MGSRLVNVYGYRYENVNPFVNALFPANVGTEEDQKEEWALISGN